MSNLTDEKLLKRKGHASRNFGVLGVLACLGALLMGFFFHKIGTESGADFSITFLFPGIGFGGGKSPLYECRCP